MASTAVLKLCTMRKTKIPKKEGIRTNSIVGHNVSASNLSSANLNRAYNGSSQGSIRLEIAPGATGGKTGVSY